MIEATAVTSKDAVAVIDCTVTDRLDAGQHWVVYINVSIVASVHHHEEGTSY